MAAAIVFYVSGHGFGHATRTIEVINAVLAIRPETRIGVRTSAPRWLFDLTVKGKIAFSTLECDTGVVQVDALTLDEADTIRRAWAFHSDLVSRAASETRILRELGAGLIVGDIPPLAFAVSAASGIPSIGLGNFTWDWVYADYPRVRLAPSLLPAIRGAYAKGSMALRLPMSGGFETFSNVRDIPMIARHATRTRQEVCKLLRLPADKPIVLMSFGGYGLPGLDTDVLSKFKKYTVVAAANLPVGRARKEAPLAARKGAFVRVNEEAMYNAGVRYEDLVGAADAVVTKPGFGIIAECIANDTAMLYTSRGHFPEYDVLVEEMPKYLRTAFIGQDELFAGKWETPLNKLLAQSKTRKHKKPDTNGADVAAELLLKTLDKPPKKPRGRPKAKKV
jgi:L-arabinokinase